MLESLFSRKEERRFPRVIYDLSCDLFSLVQFWHTETKGAERGRLFEKILTRYCDRSGLPLTEKSGSRTLRGARAASGFLHENDAVIGFPDFTLHCELKHLSSEVTKNDLLIFNQKGLDFLFAENQQIRRLPFYRLIVSGGVVSASARRFAVQWGILVVEPDRLPLTLLHFLAGRTVPNLRNVPEETQDEIWSEVPGLIGPLQDRVQRFAQLLKNGDECCVGEYRTRWAIDHLQRIIGDYYWNAMDETAPNWLEGRFEEIAVRCGYSFWKTLGTDVGGKQPPITLSSCDG